MTNKKLKLAAMSVALTACVAAQPMAAHAVEGPDPAEDNAAPQAEPAPVEGKTAEGEVEGEEEKQEEFVPPVNDEAKKDDQAPAFGPGTKTDDIAIDYKPAEKPEEPGETDETETPDGTYVKGDVIDNSKKDEATGKDGKIGEATKEETPDSSSSTTVVDPDAEVKKGDPVVGKDEDGNTTITTPTETTGTETTTTTGTGKADSSTTITDTKKGEEINLDDELGKDVRPNWKTDKDAKLGGYTVDKVEPAKDGNSKTLTLKKTSEPETKEMSAEDVAKLLDVPEGGVEKKIVFSGDIGNVNQPIIRDPSWVHGADYVVMESTYGDRNHTEVWSYTGQLAQIIDETLGRGGNVVIPAFAVGRTQELLYFIREIKDKNLVKSVKDFPVYVDSPLAKRATTIFCGDLRGYLDEEALALVQDGTHMFNFPGLHLTETVEESKLLNMDRTPKVILSASGMCDAGRIRHHLKYNLWRPESSIVFVGFQSPGTLGRTLLDGAPSVKLFGEEVAVRAKVVNFQGLSSHADHDHLVNWISQFKEPKPQHVFVVHGDREVAPVFAQTVTQLGFAAHAPQYTESYDLLTCRQLEAGYLPERKKPAFEGAPRTTAAYQRLVQLGDALLGLIRRSKGRDNKTLASFAESLRKLIEKFEF